MTRRDGKPNVERPPPARKPIKARHPGFVERATATGHSGHGSDSVRPHLRDQLRLKALLPQPFPTTDLPEVKGKDEHHQ
jgi:hypothetical protein